MENTTAKILNKNDEPVTFSGQSWEAVTPSDTENVAIGQLYIGGGGDVAVLAEGATSPETFVNVPDGSFMPLNIVGVYATGTTATDILILR